MKRAATLALGCGLLLGAPYAANFMPVPIVQAAPARKPKTPEQIMAWAFPRQLHQIARRHGWDKSEERQWLAAWRAGKVDWADLTVAGALDGHKIQRVLAEKWAGDDNEKRKALDLPLMATLAFGAGFANGGGDADGYQTGWGATTTAPQTIGGGGTRAFIHQLAPCYKLIDDGESYVWGVQAYHQSGTTCRAALEGGAWETATERTYSATHGAWGYWWTLTTDGTKDSGRAEVRAEAIPVGDGESAILGAATVGGSLAAGEERATAGEERIEFTFNNGVDAHFARLYAYVDPTRDIAVGAGTAVALADGDAVQGGTSTAIAFVEGAHAQGATSIRISVVSGTFQSGEALDKGTVNPYTGAFTTASTNVGTTTSLAVARGSNTQGFVAATEDDCVPDAEGGNLTAAAAAASFAPTGGPAPFATMQAAAVAMCDYRQTTATAQGQTGLNAGVVYDRADGGVILLAPSRRHLFGNYSVAGDIVNTDSAALEVRRATHVSTQAQCAISGSGTSSGFRTRAVRLSGVRMTGDQLSTTATGYGTGGGSNNEPVLICDDVHFIRADNTDATNGCDSDFVRIHLHDCVSENRDDAGLNATHFVNCDCINGADWLRLNRVSYGCTATDLASAGATHEDAFQINATSPLVKSNIMHFACQCIDNNASQMLFWRINDDTSVVQNTAVIGYLVYSTKAAGNSSVWRTQTDLTNVTFQACTIASDHPFNMTEDSSGSYAARNYANVIIRDCVMWDWSDTHAGTGTTALDNNHYIDMAVPGGDANGTTGGTAADIWTTPGDNGDFHPVAASAITGRTLNQTYEVDLEGTEIDATGAIGALQEPAAADPPAHVSTTVGANGTTFTQVWDEAVDEGTYAGTIGGFDLTVTGGGGTDTLTGTIDGTIYANQTVTLNLDAGSVTADDDAEPNEAISGASVTNNSSAVAAQSIRTRGRNYRTRLR